MFDLQEFEAIKRLKYKYLRCLDNKLWEEMSECFLEEATSAYSGGKYAFEGRTAILPRIHERTAYSHEPHRASPRDRALLRDERDGNLAT